MLKQKPRKIMLLETCWVPALFVSLLMDAIEFKKSNILRPLRTANVTLYALRDLLETARGLTCFFVLLDSVHFLLFGLLFLMIGGGMSYDRSQPEGRDANGSPEHRIR